MFTKGNKLRDYEINRGYSLFFSDEYQIYFIECVESTNNFTSARDEIIWIFTEKDTLRGPAQSRLLKKT